jgi:hypothetical protein
MLSSKKSHQSGSIIPNPKHCFFVWKCTLILMQYDFCLMLYHDDKLFLQWQEQAETAEYDRRHGNRQSLLTKHVWEEMEGNDNTDTAVASKHHMSGR